MKTTHIFLFALACGAAPLAALAQVQVGVNIGIPEVVVSGQPPPLRAEAIGVAPGPGYIWIRGHWGWHHERWEWIGGRWEIPAQPGTVWIPGRWAPRGNGWVWVEGHYAVQAALPPPGPGMQAEIVASEEPPEAIVETIPVAPGPDFFWIGGHWHWNRGWVWLGGHYERHPHFHPGGYWEAGRWEHRGGSWVWREGRWR
jgi:WXXGXW repeat (2 copies)